jgi:hypothetical protein
VWLRWLRSLASDPDAAIALSLLYQRLADDERDGLLAALESDVKRLGTPVEALFAPLLAVEEDPGRLGRLLRRASQFERKAEPSALRATGESAVGLVFFLPTYLSFGELLGCSIHVERGLAEVRREPLVHVTRVAEVAKGTLPGVPFSVVPFADAVDEVARAVLLTRRSGQIMPAAASRLIQLLHPEQGVLGHG